MTNADKFKNIFGLYATELWSMPEKDFLKWLNSEVMNCSESPNGWKPVSKDTNPSKSGWYIVTCPEEMAASNERFSSIAEYDATTGEWFDMDEPTDCYLAYMPLPAPYQPRRMNHES